MGPGRSFFLKDTPSEVGGHKIISFPVLEDDTESEVVSLGGDYIAVKERGKGNGKILLLKLKGTEIDVDSSVELYHEGCSAFCVDKEKTRFVSVSLKSCQVWNLEEGKAIPYGEINFPKKFSSINRIILCNDSNYLIGCGTIFSKGPKDPGGSFIFMLNLESGQYKEFKLDKDSFDIALLERGESAFLYCSRYIDQVIRYKLDTSAELMLTEPTPEHANRCITSPTGEYLISIVEPRGARDTYFEIFNVNQDLSLTNKRSLQANAFLSGKDTLVFIDKHTIVFLTETTFDRDLLGRRIGIQFVQRVLKVDLRSPQLKPEECFTLPEKRGAGLASLLRLSPFCPIPGGFLEVSGKRCVRITTVPGYELLQQAEAAIFHYYLYRTMPTPAPVSSIVAGFSGPQLSASASFFVPEGKETSTQKSERDFLNSLLDQLIKSKSFSTEDTQALKSFLAASSDPETPLSACKAVSLSGVSDAVVEFLTKLQKLDKVDKPELKR